METFGDCLLDVAKSVDRLTEDDSVRERFLEMWDQWAAWYSERAPEQRPTEVDPGEEERLRALIESPAEEASPSSAHPMCELRGSGLPGAFVAVAAVHDHQIHTEAALPYLMNPRPLLPTRVDNRHDDGGERTREVAAMGIVARWLVDGIDRLDDGHVEWLCEQLRDVEAELTDGQTVGKAPTSKGRTEPSNAHSEGRERSAGFLSRIAERLEQIHRAASGSGEGAARFERLASDIEAFIDEFERPEESDVATTQEWLFEPHAERTFGNTVF